MRDLSAELKQLRVHGMAAAWSELQEGDAEVSSLNWVLDRLLQAETADRAVRSVNNQMLAAKFPVHRDLAGWLAGFDFDCSPVDRKLIGNLAETTFTEIAHNLVFVGGTGSGKVIWRRPSACQALWSTASAFGFIPL